MRKTILLAAIALALSGCTPAYTSKMTPEEVLKNAKTKSSEFDSAEYTFLPSLHSTLNRGLLGSLDQIEFALGVSKPKDGTETTQGLMVRIKYFDTEWRFYESADFVGGIPAELKSQNRNVSGCSTYNYLASRCDYTEMVSIKLDKEFIKNNPSGFSVRLNSQQGKQNVIVVPENYMQAFAELVNK